MSSGYVGLIFSGSFSGNWDLNSFYEVLVDNLLDEFCVGGDFEGFYSMGLEDYNFDGLIWEMMFIKIYSFSMDNVNLWYFLLDKFVRIYFKVFIFVSFFIVMDE